MILTDRTELAFRGVEVLLLEVEPGESQLELGEEVLDRQEPLDAVTLHACRV